MVGGVGEDRRGIVDDGDGQRARSARAFDRGDGIGRAPARRDADHHVGRSDGASVDIGSRGVDIVLRTFIRHGQRADATRHQEDEPFHRPAEGRMQFGPVLHRKPPRRTRADEDQPAAPAEPPGSRFGGLRDRRRLRLDRGDGGHLALQHRLDRELRRPQVEIEIAGVERFGVHDILCP